MPLLPSWCRYAGGEGGCIDGCRPGDCGCRIIGACGGPALLCPHDAAFAVNRCCRAAAGAGRRTRAPSTRNGLDIICGPIPVLALPLRLPMGSVASVDRVA